MKIDAGLIWSRLLAIGLLLVSVNARPSDPALVTVDLDSNFGNGVLARMQYLAGGGFTPFFRPDARILSDMKAVGTRRMRLINVDRKVTLTMLPDGGLKVLWSKKLNDELLLCRRHGWIPHIVIGQEPPDLLRYSAGDDGWVYGPNSWELYERYITAFVKYVVNDWEFDVTEWEVGNEMDNPKFNWLSPSRLDDKLDEQGYQLYLDLYRHISNTIDRYRQSHKDKKILIGGPALTQNSFNYAGTSKRNWVLRFVRDVLSENLPADFISMHFYGSAGSAREFADRIEMIRGPLRMRGRDIPLWITEWGPTAFFSKTESVNYSPYAGAFALAFLWQSANIQIDEALFIAAREKPGKSGPALFRADGAAGHVYRVISDLTSAGKRQKLCSIESDTGGCIAAQDGQRLRIIIWNSGWIKWRAPGALSAARGDDLLVSVKIRPRAVEPLRGKARVAVNGTVIASHRTDEGASFEKFWCNSNAVLSQCELARFEMSKASYAVVDVNFEGDKAMADDQMGLSGGSH